MEIEQNTVYNCDCLELMDEMIKQNIKIDCVLTSPPYNVTIRLNGAEMYDVYNDNISNDDYTKWSVEIFNCFDKILSPNGIILWNMSYATDNTECMNLTIADILRNTNFTLADIIVWEKNCAKPNCVSFNRMTRLCEFVYVFCRSAEKDKFYMNKKVVSTRLNGQKMYETVFNLIKAKNNDEACELNRSTFSTELCVKLLNLYCQPNYLVFDPFMGTGTTAVACYKMGLKYLGAEISSAQCEWAEKRLNKLKAQPTFFD